MANIGSNVGMVSKKAYRGSSTDAVTLSWGDANVHLFEGTGAKTVYLPAGDVSNSYGEIWISNSQSSGTITINADTAATGNVQNLHGDASIVMANGETAHFFYVPYLRNYNPNTTMSDTKVDGQRRGMWIGGILNAT